MAKRNQSAEYLERSMVIFLLSGLAATLLQTALFFRPGPTGHPYVIDVWHYWPYAVYYEWYGLSLLSTPFAIAAFFLARSGQLRIAQSLAGGQIALTALILVIAQIDHELQRFMGSHLSVDLLLAYRHLSGTPGAIGAAFVDDAGGSRSAWLLLGIPIGFFLAAMWGSGRLVLPGSAAYKRSLVILGIIAFPFLGSLLWGPIEGGRLRQEKVKPAPILLFDEMVGLLTPKRQFANLNTHISTVQSHWQQRDRTGRWHFSREEYPLSKQARGQCPAAPDGPWNFVILQLETFRAKNMKLLNGALPVSPTPFLDQLATSANAAYWSRFFCNGLPTVHAFMALHTGVLPHSNKRVAAAFARNRLDAFPRLLGEHGYFRVFATASDPDWDSQRSWCSKWYDELLFDPDFQEQDRRLFRAAAAYLKDRPFGQRPFLATIASISNHLPFRSPEPSLDLNNGETLSDRLHNTMHYTDDVIREFFQAIDQEPWFQKTIFIISGDHGYDLGDRGETLGHTNLRSESTWVPLIIVGNHPRLPRGPQTATGSQIDIAPTIMDLAGICDDNSFMGHSLLDGSRPYSSALTIKDGHLAYSTDRSTAYLPVLGAPMLYDASDVLHQTDIAAQHPQLVAEAQTFSTSFVELVDHLYETNRLVPPPKP